MSQGWAAFSEEEESKEWLPKAISLLSSSEKKAGPEKSRFRCHTSFAITKKRDQRVFFLPCPSFQEKAEDYFWVPGTMHVRSYLAWQMLKVDTGLLNNPCAMVGD